jgi:hypothetical protein
MLTIKIVRNRGTPEYREFVQEIRSVALNPESESQSGHPSVSFFDALGVCVDIFEGDVYVMNENGKTIADYNLNYPT